MKVGSRVVLRCEQKEFVPFRVTDVNGNMIGITRKMPIFICGKTVLRDDIQIRHVECLKEL